MVVKRHNTFTALQNCAEGKAINFCGQQHQEEGMQRFFTVNDDGLLRPWCRGFLCCIGIRFRIIPAKFGRRIGRNQRRREER